MIPFLRLFAAFVDLENLAATQAEALETEVRAHEATRQELEIKSLTLETERTRRISADAMASERREEIDRLVAQNHELMEQSQAIMSDRLKSLDSLNLKLMEARTVEQTPDLAKFNALEKLKGQVVQDIRSKDLAMDRLLLTTMHPAFKKRVTMNEPAPPVEETAA